MQSGRCTAVQQPTHSRSKNLVFAPFTWTGPLGGCTARHYAVERAGTRALARAVPGQKDVTSELLERAFTLALTTRLKQYASINVDVRSTAWGLLEGKFGGMTVRGYSWRTPLELTAQQLMVDFGEMILDYQKLVWQQTVALKNVPQGSVSFTLTSQDLANFMVHPIMVAAAGKAIQGHEFVFDRNTASVRLDPASGRGVINYQGIWAGDGERYAVTMITPPPTAAARPGVLAATSNTLEQLTVSARRLAPTALSTTGSYASMGSSDQPLGAPAVVAVASGTAAAASPSRFQTLTMAPSYASPARTGSLDDQSDPGAGLVAEGLRWFFSGLVLNMQGIEMRHPVLLVQLPGPGVGAAVAGGRPPPLRQQAPPSLRQAPPSPESGPIPALLTITMKVAIIQLPPLNMKF